MKKDWYLFLQIKKLKFSKNKSLAQEHTGSESVKIFSAISNRKLDFKCLKQYKFINLHN